MVLVIIWGIGDLVYVLYQRLAEPPFMLLQISDILSTFGAFLAVLIAIGIFINISTYLTTDVIPVRLVVATALMAISRKVIIFDFERIEPPTDRPLSCWPSVLHTGFSPNVLNDVCGLQRPAQRRGTYAVLN